jgi:hypothetical protein
MFLLIRMRIPGKKQNFIRSEFRSYSISCKLSRIISLVCKEIIILVKLFLLLIIDRLSMIIPLRLSSKFRRERSIIISSSVIF